MLILKIDKYLIIISIYKNNFIININQQNIINQT